MSKMGGGFTSPLMQYPWSLASLSYYPRRLEDYVYSCTTAKIIPLPQLNVAESLKRAVSHPSSIHSASSSWVFCLRFQKLRWNNLKLNFMSQNKPSFSYGGLFQRSVICKCQLCRFYFILGFVKERMLGKLSASSLINGINIFDYHCIMKGSSMRWGIIETLPQCVTRYLVANLLSDSIDQQRALSLHKVPT